MSGSPASEQDDIIDAADGASLYGCHDGDVRAPSGPRRAVVDGELVAASCGGLSSMTLP